MIVTIVTKQRRLQENLHFNYRSIMSMIVSTEYLVKHDNPLLISKNTDKKAKVQHRFYFYIKAMILAHYFGARQNLSRQHSRLVVLQLLVVVDLFLDRLKISFPQLILTRKIKQKRFWIPYFLLANGLKMDSYGGSVSPAHLLLD